MVFRIDLKILFFLILFYFTKQIKIYIIVMICAIMHEFGHLLIGIILKMKVKQMTLMPMGLSIEFYSNETQDEKKTKKSNLIEIKKIIIAFAGPFVNFLLVALAEKFYDRSEILVNIIYANFLIGLFNLLPIYPLDGGRILNAVLCLIFEKENADFLTSKITNVVLFIITFLASILVYYFKNVALLFIAIYLGWVVFRETKFIDR